MWHVAVATGLTTSVDRVRKRVQLGLKLGEDFDVGVIVRQVWQVSGLPASMLVGIRFFFWGGLFLFIHPMRSPQVLPPLSYEWSMGWQT